MVEDRTNRCAGDNLRQLSPAAACQDEDPPSPPGHTGRFRPGRHLVALAHVRTDRAFLPAWPDFRGGHTRFDLPRLERSNKPADDPGDHKFGAVWVTEPAVIIRFSDPKHGFTLPPTKFAVLTFSENQAVTLSTSPMLDPLPFDEAVAILENQQNQFKAGGWEPWAADDSTWFDLTEEGKKRLYARMFRPGYMQTASLRIPKLYGITFRLKCNEGCWTREPPYLFLIDIGVGNDYESDDPLRWRRPGAAVAAGSVQ